MKIGVFDSGLGGLLVAKSLFNDLPKHDYLYLGDTANLPYGNKNQAQLYELTKRGVEYLFRHDCHLIIIACNTASAEALRKIQQAYLPKHLPDRKVLGVIIPTVEVALDEPNVKRVGALATKATVESRAFVREIHKLNPNIEVFQQAAPRLVEALESDDPKSRALLKRYLDPLQAAKIDTLILGCTHYGLVIEQVKAAMPGIRIISAHLVIAQKLKDYLLHHPEIDWKLGQNSSREYKITSLSERFPKIATQMFGQPIKLELTKIEPSDTIRAR